MKKTAYHGHPRGLSLVFVNWPCQTTLERTTWNTFPSRISQVPPAFVVRNLLRAYGGDS